tara:strand:- start:503 stop:1024 length:522 start_codon:yes stop_codon:yes gene_type:complete
MYYNLKNAVIMSYLINNNSNIFNVQAQKASSISSQTGSSSYQDLTSSDITYSCDSTVSKVVYEYTANFVRGGGYGVGLAKLLQYNTSTSAWEDVSASHYVSFGLGSNGGYPRDNTTFKFVLDSWSGNKQLKMQWKVITGGMSAHHAEYVTTLGGTNDTSYIIKPFLIVYSIKN